MAMLALFQVVMFKSRQGRDSSQWVKGEHFLYREVEANIAGMSG